MARKSKELQEIKEYIYNEVEIDEINIEELFIEEDILVSLQEGASYLSDNRLQEYVHHTLEDILLIVILAIIARCDTFVEIEIFIEGHEEWLREKLNLTESMPSISTIKRVIAHINPRELEELLLEILIKYLKQSNKVFYEDEDIVIEDLKSMDGKTANSSCRKSSKDGKINKVNAMSMYSITKEMCEATEFIEKKTNEIPTGILLLKRVNIANSIIVFDALNTQAKTIQYIVENKGYYVAPVKRNQKELEEEISTYFYDTTNLKDNENVSCFKTIEKSHGHVEKREYVFTSDVDWINQKDKWKDLKTIGYSKRTYTNSEGKEVSDIRYYISNIDAQKSELLSKAIRGEWCVENGLHLYLDMTFNEDKNKCFEENSQKNLNIIRKFVLALLKKYKETTKLSMNSIRFKISMKFEEEIDKIIATIIK